MSIILALILIVTNICSNQSIVNVIAGSTQVMDISEKQLIQYSDNWVIFRYSNSNGIFDFEVLYDDKSVEKLQKEGFSIQYQIIYRAGELGNTSPWKDINDKTELIKAYEQIRQQWEGKYYIRFQIVQKGVDTAISKSDALYLENNNKSFAYLNEYFYDLTKKQPNKLTLNIKVNQHLKQIGDISALVRVKRNYLHKDEIFEKADSYVESHPISNVKYQNYSKKYTLGEKTYEIAYSIISLEIDVLPALDNDYIEADSFYITGMDYALNFNGLLGENNNQPVEEFNLKTYIPSVSLDSITQVETILINAPATTINVGKTICLTAEIFPSNATVKDLRWSSSNWNYADVTDEGIVTAYAEGAGKTVVITACSTDCSDIKATYILTIKGVPTSSIEVKPKNILVNSIKIIAPATQIQAGKAITLKANINSNATNKSVVWSSSNTKYATVNAKGVVTTKKAGAGKTVTITAKAKDDSGKTATFKLKIKKVPVKKIKLKAKKTIKAGKKLKIKLTINSDATNKAVKWSVNNKKYAKINSKGVLTAKKAGKGKTIKVTAKAKDGSGKKATIKIRCK